jgi:hypothetical protein
MAGSSTIDTVDYVGQKRTSSEAGVRTLPVQ